MTDGNAFEVSRKSWESESFDFDKEGNFCFLVSGDHVHYLLKRLTTSQSWAKHNRFPVNVTFPGCSQDLNYVITSYVI